MARITVEDCLTRENNRFALVLLASKRTKQLLQGARSASSDPRGNKPVVTALREIAEGKVRFMTPEEAQLAKEMEEQRKAEAEAAQGPQNGNSIPEIDRLFAEVTVTPEPAAADGDEDSDEPEEKAVKDSDEAE